MKFAGGDIARPRMQLVQTVVVPGTKAKFVEAALDVP